MPAAVPTRGVRMANSVMTHVHTHVFSTPTLLLVIFSQLLIFSTHALMPLAVPARMSSGGGKAAGHKQAQQLENEQQKSLPMAGPPSPIDGYYGLEGLYRYDEPQPGGRDWSEAQGGYPTIIDFDELQQQQQQYPQSAPDGYEPTPADSAEALAATVPIESGEIEASANVYQLPASIGHAAGLAMLSSVDGKDENLLIFHRADRVWEEGTFDAKTHRLNRTLASGPIAKPTLAVVNPASGGIVAQHGANLFYMPHGLATDTVGNVWVTDVGSHQVMKLDGKSFKPLLVLGERLVPGNDSLHFCKPTDVAVAKSGEFFVADGYCNSRVMKFDKEGRFITSFGRPNSNPPNIGEFFVPHSLVLIEDLNLLCVADRENERIQCFAAGLNDEGGSLTHHPRAYIPTGTFFTKAERIGRVFAIREKQHYLVGVTDRDAREQVDPQVFVMDMNTGRANTFAKGLENAHAVALSNHGDIFVAQLNPSQIVKFSMPPAPGGEL